MYVHSNKMICILYTNYCHICACGLYTALDSSQVISYYYTWLENYMDADSVSHMMHCERLITNDDYEAITAAPNDNKMNTLLLQYVRSMNVSQLTKFCDILKIIETYAITGDCLSTCKCMRLYCFISLYAAL